MLRLLNCTSETLRIVEVKVGGPSHHEIWTPTGATLAPGAIYVRRWMSSIHAGQQQVVAIAQGERSKRQHRASATLVIRNPTLERARARCRSCRGVFTMNRQSNTSFCRCPSPGARKRP